MINESFVWSMPSTPRGEGRDDMGGRVWTRTHWYGIRKARYYILEKCSLMKLSQIGSMGQISRDPDEKKGTLTTFWTKIRLWILSRSVIIWFRFRIIIESKRKRHFRKILTLYFTQTGSFQRIFTCLHLSIRHVSKNAWNPLIVAMAILFLEANTRNNIPFQLVNISIFTKSPSDWTRLDPNDNSLVGWPKRKKMSGHRM